MAYQAVGTMVWILIGAAFFVSLLALYFASESIKKVEFRNAELFETHIKELRKTVGEMKGQQEKALSRLSSLEKDMGEILESQKTFKAEVAADLDDMRGALDKKTTRTI